MDAYIIQQKMLAFWQKLATPTSGASVSPSFTSVPVYVKINGRIIPISNVVEDNNCIILEI